MASIIDQYFAALARGTKSNLRQEAKAVADYMIKNRRGAFLRTWYTGRARLNDGILRAKFALVAIDPDYRFGLLDDGMHMVEEEMIRRLGKTEEVIEWIAQSNI